MTPPPRASRPGAGTSHRPPSFYSSSFHSTPFDKQIQERTVPLPPTPTFADVLDVLDSMMSYPPPHPRTHRTRWNGKKALVVTGQEVVSHLITCAFAVGQRHAAAIAHTVVRAGGLIPTFLVQSSSNSFVPDSSSTYVFRAISCIPDHGLNSLLAFPKHARPMLEVLLDLNDAFQEMCNVSVSMDGRFVDYGVIRGTLGWRRALALLCELAVCDDTDFANVDDVIKKACFFNLYNLLIVHAKLVFGHPTDLVRRGKFFNDAAYVIAGKRITSVELEHEVLRRRMMSGDDRSSWRVRSLDARMHFILNCGAHSCPPLQAVDAKEAETTMREAAMDFIETNVVVDLMSNRVTLSRLFKWFRNDFTPGSDKDDDLIGWIERHADHDQRARLHEVQKRQYKIKFAVYNWADNGDMHAKPDIRFMSIYDHSFARTA